MLFMVLNLRQDIERECNQAIAAKSILQSKWVSSWLGVLHSFVDETLASTDGSI